MKIFITGVSGFIGHSLSDFYLNRNYQVQGFYRNQSIVQELDHFKPDVIINCAGEIYNPEFMFDTNVSMVKTILDWLRKFPKTKLVHLGSSSEYGPLNNPGAETDRINPIDMYQSTKGMGTLLCQGYSRHYNLDISVARVYSAYGPYERPHRLFPRLYRAFIKNEDMTLFDGVHDFIYIDDFIRGIDMLVNTKDLRGEIVNFGSGRQYTNIEVLQAWEKITGHSAPVKYEHKFNKTFETSVWCCDTTYAYQQYGFETQISLEQGIEKFIETLSK